MCSRPVGSLNAVKVECLTRVQTACAGKQRHSPPAESSAAMARHSAARVGGRAPRAWEQQPSSGKAQPKAPLGLHFGGPYGSWGDNALSLLSAQASLSAELASPRKAADMPPDAICRITPRSGEAHPRAEGADDAAQERQRQEAAQPCDSDGLTADGGSDLPEGDNSPAPVNSGTTAAPPEDGSSPPPVHHPGKKGKRWAQTSEVRDSTHSVAACRVGCPAAASHGLLVSAVLHLATSPLEQEKERARRHIRRPHGPRSGRPRLSV